MSSYQSLKVALLDAVPLARDAFHIYIGFACFVVALLVMKKPLRSFWLLAPGIVVAVALEAIDMRDDVAFYGYVRWTNSAIDVVNTNVIPFVLVLLARAGVISTKKPS